VKKVKLINTVTCEEMQALYNPEELTERIKVVRESQKRLKGLPRERYSHTERQAWSMTFYIDDANYEKNPFMTGEFKRFIRSLCYSVGLPNGEIADPPDVLFIWGNLLTELCHITGDVEFKHTRFRQDLSAMIYTARLMLKESGYTMITSESAYSMPSARNDFLVL